jgi:hypothetical protein
MLHGLFLWLIIAWTMVSVYIAAHAMDHDKSGLWGVAVFFFGIFGLAFYAISLAGDN